VQELILQGNAQPQMDASIYARTSGYLKKWYADIGAHVKAGQLLAEIEAPDLDDQLEQAKADLETAKSNLKLAETQATRWQGLLQTNAVSQDEADQKNAAFAADRAIVNSGTANVKHLEDLKSFERVTAPFDGVITARRVDVGALINTGSGSAAGPELFHIVSADRLRVFINVPEEYQRLAENGAKETLTLTEYPGRFFTGTIARNSGAIDPSSRTLQVEVDVENPNGEILPGAYVLVHFKLPDRGNAMTVPVNTVLFRSEGLRVAVVRDGKAELVPVQVGRDFGDSLEIVSGITAKETLIVNPPDSLVSGASVQISDSAGR
jgi:RND family efflux transporter MFP subunit